MLLISWLDGLRRLCTTPPRFRRRPARRAGFRRSLPEAALASTVDTLEERTLLSGAGPSLVFITPNVPTPGVGGLEDGDVLTEAPREFVLQFSPGQSLDPSTLEGGIQIRRSGFDGDFSFDEQFLRTDAAFTVDATGDPASAATPLVELAQFQNLNDLSNIVIAGNDFFGSAIPTVNFGAASGVDLSDPGTTLGDFVTVISGAFDGGTAVLTVDGRIEITPDAEVVPPGTASLTLTFEPGGFLDSAALPGFEFFDTNDVFITPGFIGFGEPGFGGAQNQVVIRFAETLPDDHYQLVILGGGATPLTNAAGDAFNDGENQIINFRLQLAPQAVGVVPQPVFRDGTMGTLAQATDQIVVYFNHDELDPASAVNPAFYRLHRIDPATGETLEIEIAGHIEYLLDDFTDPSRPVGIATLHFDTELAPGTWNLRIGVSDGYTNRIGDATAGISDASVNLGTLFTSTLQTPSFQTVSYLGDHVHFVDAGNLGSTDREDDIDLYKFSLADAPGNAGVTVTVDTGGRFTAVIRLFDEDGQELDASQTGSLSAQLGGGVYYVGVSGSGNETYDATTGELAGGEGGAPGEFGSYTFEINVTNRAVPVDTANNPANNNSSFETASSLGVLGAAGQTFSAAIAAAPLIPHPAFPGGIDEPGHRLLPFFTVPSESHLDGDVGTGLGTPSIQTLSYNFQSFYGFDPQGNPLHNAITENQKQRAREIFELLSYYSGLQFRETPSSGFTIVTGDVRALDPTSTAPGIAGGNRAVMNDSIDWGESEYGGAWFRVAMHEIMHLVGIGHSYDLSSIMGAGLSGEPVFPGDHDLVHLQRLWPALSTDIDVYQFALEESGWFTAETVAQRLEATSQLDTVLTLYRETSDGGRELIARNDDYFSKDSFLELRLEAGTYFIVVSSTGNTQFDPTILNSGFGGTTAGAYQLKLDFIPDPPATIVDLDGTPLDGSLDGRPGGVFEFWFQTGDTLFVDKQTGSATGDGSLQNPFRNINQAFAAAQPGEIVRIVGNDENLAYQIGVNGSGVALQDGSTFRVPQGVTVMIDAGAILKLRSAIIDVGSSAVGIDRSEGALQVLGTPHDPVFFTSWHDKDPAFGAPTGPPLRNPQPGDWGGIVFNNELDRHEGRTILEDAGIFLNYVGHAQMFYGGGSVFVDSVQRTFTPIHLADARPTLIFNTITLSADAAISADLPSFRDDDGRIGPHVRGNTLIDNSVNGLFVRIETEFGTPLEKLDGFARWNDTDIVYVLTENLHIVGGAGGPLGTTARLSGRLAIDPGVVVKLLGSRIEAEVGSANLIAEGTAQDPIVFTSLFDDRYGRGGTFDTTSDGDITTPAAGDWGGIMFRAVSSGSIDHALLTFGGGVVPIEGTFAGFNVIEIHQADVRIANSVIEHNAGGLAGSNRTGRGNNAAAAIFIRGAQPIIVDNVIRDNQGVAISVNANAMQARFVPDWGRSTGLIDRYAEFDDNRGPLVRLNRLDNNTINGMEVRGGLLTTETVWDDTDIVHVLRSEIVVLNHHTLSGLRLESDHRGSLVVKLQGANAGFTADGVPLEIFDRIGGTVHVVGTPNFPVVLTSLNDSTVGAGLRPDGQTQRATNNNPTSTAQPGDWRSIRLDRYSNDRNVAIINEREPSLSGGEEFNGTPSTAQHLGELAPDELEGDDNRRLGFEVHGFISLDNPADVDVYSFRGVAGTEIWIDVDRTSPSLDLIIELIDANGNVLARAINNTIVVGSAAVPALTMLKDQNQRKVPGAPGDGDFFTTNPRDPGMRLVLPGSPGAVGTYFIRVRSNPLDASQPDSQAHFTNPNLNAPANPLNNLDGGLTSGAYQLQVRLSQLDEFPGSTVRFADIRYATNGIEIYGLPAHSPLLGETAEAAAFNNTMESAQYLGNLLATDRATISVSGTMSGLNDIDWYSFDLDYSQIQGTGIGMRTFAAIFDIDYADGLTRPDTILSVFNAQGQLILVARASDIADDQPGMGLGLNADDLSRGSFGVNDPYLGTVHMPAGSTAHGTTQRYFLAVSTAAQLPSVLNATFTGTATSPLIRLEPVNSIRRIVEDHIGFGGYTSHGNQINPVTQQIFNISTAAQLETQVIPFTLSDVLVYRYSGTQLFAGSTGGQTFFDLGGPNFIGDLVIRRDGRMFVVQHAVPAADNTPGNLLELDPGTGAVIASFAIDIPNLDPDADPLVLGQLTSNNIDALAFREQGGDAQWLGFNDLFLSVRGAVRPGDPGNDIPHTIDPTSSTLYIRDPNSGAVGARANSGFVGEIFETAPGDLGITTGMAFIGGSLFGVNNQGEFYQISTATGQAFDVVDIGLGAFQALTRGPLNVEGGIYANRLFALTSTGILVELDTDGNVLSTSSIGGGTGVAFSPLDFNLWHPTMRRGNDAGHGINPAFDNSRNPGAVNRTINGRPTNEAAGGASFYFGLEAWQADPTSAYFTYGPNAQLGILTRATHEALSSNPVIGNNYNLPGGALGSLVSDSFSLAGYNPTDLPTLYFNYFLETQGAAGNQANTMQDSARVFVSADGGANWILVATNNSQLSTPNTQNAELPAFLSSSAAVSGFANQQVQELFDNSGVWRQARVDLSNFAGQDNLILRFDFSTAGSMNQGLTGDAFGVFNNAQRGQNNAFEGFYIDDIIVGFAERGEMVTGAPGGQTGFFSVPPNPHVGAPAPISSGPYQLEIRRGTEYAIQDPLRTPFGGVPRDADLQLRTQLFDTNDRLVTGFTLRAPAVANISLGATFTISDGWPTATGPRSFTFEFTTDAANGSVLGNGNIAVNISGIQTGAQVALRIAQAINSLDNFDVQADARQPRATPNLPGLQTRIHDDRVALTGATSVTATFGGFVESHSGFGSNRLRMGDSNVHRDQGHVEIVSNTISFVFSAGIRVQAGARDSEGNVPHPGAPIATPVLNTERLSLGVVIANNVIHNFAGGAGIVFGGDPNTGADFPLAAVPFGRIINNTIYGGDTPAGTGIQVIDNASPTIINNIVANTSLGISVSANSSSTVVTTTNFHGNTANGTLGTFPNAAADRLGDASVPGEIFVNPRGVTNDAGVLIFQPNFYLVQQRQSDGSLNTAIDSSLNSLQERSAFNAVKSSVGLPPWPIIAPERDRFGQLRIDDPAVPPPPGLGSNIFKDRGAIERADFIPPVASHNPDPASVKVINGAVLVTEFVIQFSDEGVGIDHSTITAGQFELRRFSADLPEEGQLLVEGTDYIFVYNDNTEQATFITTLGAWPLKNVFEVTINNNADPADGPLGIRDLAGNFLAGNQPDDTTRFYFVLTGENAPPFVALPQGQQLVEINEQLVFSTATGNAITVGDPDVFFDRWLDPDMEVRVTVSVTDPDTGDPRGEFTALGDVAGLSLLTFQDNNSTVILQGTLAAVNAALDGLTFLAPGVPPEGGDALLTVLVDDLGNRGSAAPNPLTAQDSLIITVTPVLPKLFFDIQETTADPRRPGVDIPTVVGLEGNDGDVTNFEFTVTLDRSDQSVNRAVTVLVTTEAGSAVAGVDYNTAVLVFDDTLGQFVETDTITFDPLEAGATEFEQTLTIVVQVFGNDVLQGDRDFFVILSDPVSLDDNDQPVLGALFLPNKDQARGIIIEDDFPVVSIDDVIVSYSADAERTAVFTVTATLPAAAAADFQTTVDFRTNDENDGPILVFPADAGATPLQDFAPASGTITLTFAAGQQTATQTIEVLVRESAGVDPNNPADLERFLDKSFIVDLANAATTPVSPDIPLSQDGTTIDQAQGTGLILGQRIFGFEVDSREQEIVEQDLDPVTGEPIEQVLEFHVGIFVRDEDGNLVPKALPSLPNAVPAVGRVDFQTQDVTATGSQDYVPASGTLEFDPGVERLAIPVTVLGDLITEYDETFELLLSMSAADDTGGKIAAEAATATGTIIDDDPAPIVSIDDVIVRYDGTDSRFIEFTVTATLPDPALVDAPDGYQAFVGFRTSSLLVGPADEAAEENVHYVFAEGVLVFDFAFDPAGPAGPIVLTQTIQVEVLPSPTDGLDRFLDRSFVVDLFIPDGTPPRQQGLVNFNPADGGRDQGHALILGQRLFAIDNPQVVEQDPGDPGSTVMLFTVTISARDADGNLVAKALPELDNAEPLIGRVNFQTQAGTALAFQDFVPTGGLREFAPGVETVTIPVTVLRDFFIEYDETFNVLLAVSPQDETGAKVADDAGVGTGTIIDNEPVPLVTVNDVIVRYDGSGNRFAEFTVTASLPEPVTAGSPGGYAFTVDFATSDFLVLPADDAARAGVDYLTTTGTLTFDFQPNGPTSLTQTILVEVLPNATQGPDRFLDRSFVITLSNAQTPLPRTFGAADLLRHQGTALILGQRLFSIDNQQVVEPDVDPATGQPQQVPMVFTVSINNPLPTLPEAVPLIGRVNFQTENETATASQDYIATSGTLEFGPGDLTRPITVTILGDLIDEFDETFRVVLSMAATDETGGDVDPNASVGIGTIIDNDPAPLLSISNVVINPKGLSGVREAVFIVSMSHAVTGQSITSGKPVSVSFQTVNGTALQGIDYQGVNGTLNFPVGTTTQQIVVPVFGNTVERPDPIFFVDLFNPVNATIATPAAGRGTGTIVDNRFVSISDAVVIEPQPGARSQAVFEVTLSKALFPGDTATVNFATQSVTAQSGRDFVSTSGTLTFTAGGPLTRTIVVDILNNGTLGDPDLTFRVNLSSPTLVFIDRGQAQGTIVDNIRAPYEVFATDVDSSSLVRVVDSLTGQLKFEFFPYTANFTGGVRVARGDVTGDGFMDIIVAPGPGRRADIRIFSGRDGSLIGEFRAHAAITSGVHIAVGDVNGDGRDDIIVARGPDAGSARRDPGPHIEVYSGADFSLLFSRNVFGAGYQGGFRVAAGDVNGDGHADIIVARDRGGKVVRVFSGRTDALIHQFTAFAGTVPGGVFLAAGDVTGDGRADIVAGNGSGPSIVRIFSGATGNPVRTILTSASDGVRVAAADVTGNGRADIITAPGGGTPRIHVYSGVNGALLNTFLLPEGPYRNGVFVAGRTSATATQIGPPIIVTPGQIVATGADAGAAPRIRVFDAVTQDELFDFLAFPAGFRGGVRVALADVTGDGVVDIIATPGPGRAGVVRIFSSIDGSLIRQFAPFGPGYEGGLFVAAGDFNGDGVADIAVGRQIGLGQVRVFSGAGGPLLQGFSPFGPDYRGGVTLAVGDVNGNGTVDLITGTFRNGTTVRLVSGDWLADGTGPRFLGAFHAFPGLTTGVFVAGADLSGNGAAEVIVGRARGVGQIRVFDGATRQRQTSFNAFPDGGVRVAAGDLTGDGRFEILAGAGPGRSPLVRVYDGQTSSLITHFLGEDQQFLGGIFVAGQVAPLASSGSPQLLEGDRIAPAADVAALTRDELAAVVWAAMDRFESAGLDAASLERLRNVQFVITDLDGRLLGLSNPGQVRLDRYAGGHGWFVDPTPDSNEEFLRGATGQWYAVDERAAGRVDLLTVVMHELGHQLGLPLTQGGHGLMNETLAPGVRRELDEAFADEELFERLLFPTP